MDISKYYKEEPFGLDGGRIPEMGGGGGEGPDNSPEK